MDRPKHPNAIFGCVPSELPYARPHYLLTKLYIPPPRPELVPRPRLIERLNVGLHRKLSIISAPAGYGKTTLLSEWISSLKLFPSPTGRGVRGEGRLLYPGFRWTNRTATWCAFDHISDRGVTDRTIEGEHLGAGVLAALQSPQPPSVESILTALLNEISAVPERLILVLDDYHSLDSNRWIRPWPSSSSTCRPRSTWWSPPVKTRPCLWPVCAPVPS